MTAMGAKQTTPAAPTGKGHAARFASKKPQFKGVFMIMERDDSHYGPAGTVVAVSSAYGTSSDLFLDLTCANRRTRSSNADATA